MSSARFQPGYGRGEHAIDMAEYETFDAEVLLTTMREVYGEKRYKPPVLPAAAHEIIDLSKRARVSFEDVQRVVEKDATIAGKVLQVAQSPIYATRVKPRTLRDAVQRLGLNNIRDIVWQVALDMRVFRAPGYEGIMTALQQHSAATAHVAKVVCLHTSVANEYAFLCGLLHDVGVSALLIALAEKYGREAPAIEVVWDGLRDAHCVASAFLAEHWKLDPDLKLVVGEHHGLGREPIAHPLVAVLSLSEEIVLEAGFGMGLGEEYPAFESVGADLRPRALATLSLDETALERVRAEAREALTRMR